MSLGYVQEKEDLWNLPKCKIAMNFPDNFLEKTDPKTVE